MLIPSILVKRNPNLTAIASRVNDMLRDLCEKNGFSFIFNVITTDYTALQFFTDFSVSKILELTLANLNVLISKITLIFPGLALVFVP